jgi:RHS repeat-associated protein
VKNIIALLVLHCGTPFEAHAYRDLETGQFITRDPAGFVDGPNVYTYVRQNP